MSGSSNIKNTTPWDSPSSSGEPGEPLEVEITIDLEVTAPVHSLLLTQAAEAAARLRGFTCGQIGVRVTDDATIHQINARHLGHDYATDVISFGYRLDEPLTPEPLAAEPSTEDQSLSDGRRAVEGEMVVSVDTARVRAAEMGWSMDHELCLYVVHGTLHITGMDDHDSADRLAMRSAESQVMKSLGIEGMDRYGADCVGSSNRDGKTESSP